MTPVADGTAFTPDEAEAKLRQHLRSTSLLSDAAVVRMSDFDLSGLFAFSVLPKVTGQAGEITFLVNASHVFSSGRPTDFKDLMRYLQVGSREGALDVRSFAPLFLRMSAQRRGVVLERPDSHPLLREGQLPRDRFVAPSSTFDASGIRYRFWIFDTDRMEPSLWDVQVAPDGTTTVSPT